MKSMLLALILCQITLNLLCLGRYSARLYAMLSFYIISVFESACSGKLRQKYKFSFRLNIYALCYKHAGRVKSNILDISTRRR